MDASEIGPIAIKPKYFELLQIFDFKPFGIRGTKFTLDINHSSNCQSRIWIHILNGEKIIRVSVGEKETDFIDAVDLFETENIDKIICLITLIKSD